jgi:pyruvate kinase
MKPVYKKTKIIATIGPASRSVNVIRGLLDNGADVFRINFSHGKEEEHRATVEMIKQAGKELGMFPGILADLQGPKIRTGSTHGDKTIFLEEGRKVILTERKILCTESVISIDYQGILSRVKQGQQILINDGAVKLKVSVIKKDGDLVAIVMNGGTYSSHKGINMPNIRLPIPSLTEKDRKDVAFLLSHEFHFVALSFVRNKKDLEPLSSLIKKSGKNVKIIAKIEKPEAAKNLGEILDSCDGIMVARGDLGVETSPYKVPLLQKQMIEQANKKGKIVIVATQMLESMMEHSIPTRAESSDVANAILDGADCLMLSGETAVGKYPERAVETMRNIATTTEKSSYFPEEIVEFPQNEKSSARAMCEAAAWASRDMGNIPVLVFTLSGNTATLLSKIRNQSRIFAFSPDPVVVCQLSMAWNASAFVVPFNESMVTMIQQAENILLKDKFVRKNDLVLVVSGTTPVRGATNFVRMKRVGVE